MDPMVICVVVGIAVATYLGTRLQRQKNQTFAASIEPVLRERGAMTLPEVTEALGLKGFYARGKVVLALGEMVNAGKLETIPAPEGTPQLEKVNFIKYRLRG